jgi:hypothetical protein
LVQGATVEHTFVVGDRQPQVRSAFFVAEPTLRQVFAHIRSARYIVTSRNPANPVCAQAAASPVRAWSPESAALGTPRFQQSVAQVVETGEAAAATATDENPFEPNPERERVVEDSLVGTEDEEGAPRLGFSASRLSPALRTPP